MADNNNSLGMDAKTAGWFSYILSIISAIIVLATCRDDRNVRLHAWQSLFLGCFMIAAYIVLAIIVAIAAAASGFVFFYSGFVFFSILNWLLGLGWLALTIICIIQASQNSIFKIPVIYNWAEKMK